VVTRTMLFVEASRDERRDSACPPWHPCLAVEQLDEDVNCASRACGPCSDTNGRRQTPSHRRSCGSIWSPSSACWPCVSPLFVKGTDATCEPSGVLTVSTTAVAPEGPEIPSATSSTHADLAGGHGEVWIEHQDRQDAVVSSFTPRLLSAAAICPGDAKFYLGCGCGMPSLYAIAHAAGAGRVLGVDVSDPMLERARQVAAARGAGNVSFELVDAAVHPFEPASFGVVISRFGMMFFAAPEPAFANIRRAMRPEGRLAFTCWQTFERNEHAALPLRVVADQAPLPHSTGAGGPGPHSLFDPDHVRDLLTDAGFNKIRIEPVEGPLRVGDDADHVLAFYRVQPAAKSFPPDLIDRTLETIRAALVPHETPDGVFLESAAWLVSAQA